ncbi:MAG: ACT domain-containing protein [Chitinophagaceae bacterium]
MPGETNLQTLLKTLEPALHTGNYVYCRIANASAIQSDGVLLLFKETEGHTVIIKKEMADDLQLPYTFVASRITLKIYSSLEAVGITAAFSTALSAVGISCKLVAAFYHDPIFVNTKHSGEAMEILTALSRIKG